MIVFAWIIAGSVFALGLLNLSGMVLSRAVARLGEVRCRVTLGASRAAIARQLIAESAIQALLAAAVAISVIPSLSRAVLDSIPLGPFAWFTSDVTSRLSGIDTRMVLFILSLSALASIVLGLAPMIGAYQGNFLSGGLPGNSSTPAHSSRLLRWAVVCPQLILATTLLIVAGSALTEWRAVARTPLGYVPEGIATVKLDLAEAEGATPVALLDSLNYAPAVSAAALTNALPSEPREGLVRSEKATATGAAPERISQVRVTPDYFPALGVALEAGRIFGSTESRLGVAVVDRALADRLWPGEPAVGRRVILGATAASRSASELHWTEIVGVVGTVAWPVPGGLRQGSIYLPARGDGGEDILIVKASGSLAEVQQVVLQHLSLGGKGTGSFSTAALSDSIAQRRYPRLVITTLLSVSSLLGVALALLGIFSVTSYGVSRREREFGIRLALGADKRAIVRLVTLEAGLVTFVASVGGVFLGTLLLGVIGSRILGVGATSWNQVLVVILSVGAAVVVAVLFPATRASKANPTSLLQSH